MPSAKSVHTAKFDRCVRRVKRQMKKYPGKYDDNSPYAICMRSVGYKGSIKKRHRR